MAAWKRKNSRGVGTQWVIILVLILLFVVVACLRYQQQTRSPVAPPSTESTADLVSDDRIIFGGIPRAQSHGGDEVTFTTLRNDAYIVGYSENRKDPLWVAYRVFHNPHPFNLPRPTGGFLTDDRTESHVKETAYTHSGYDRGHMAPNSAIAHCYGAEAQLQTFLLSNICPQSPALNEKVWERLEVDERQYADQLEEVWVIDGPIFADLNHGQTQRLASGVAVPTAFYKILLDEEGGTGSKPRIFSVIMPQDVKGTELPQQFLTNVREIEHETHLDFFWKLDQATQDQLETKTWPMW